MYNIIAPLFLIAESFASLRALPATTDDFVVRLKFPHV